MKFIEKTELSHVVRGLKTDVLPSLKSLMTCPDKQIVDMTQTLTKDIETFIEDFDKVDVVTAVMLKRCETLFKQIDKLSDIVLATEPWHF